MENMLNNPAVQSAVVPLIIGGIWVFLFKKQKPVWLGLAGIVAFMVTVGLVSGYQLSPLTSTRKIVVIALCSAGIGLVLDFLLERFSPKPVLITIIVCILSGLGLLWVIWPIISRGEASWLEVSLVVYVMWIMAIVQLQTPEKQSISLISLGIGTAVVCILGASALFGQLATPFSVVVGISFLFALLHISDNRLARALYVPAALVPAVLAAGATVFASLSALVLLVLGLIPALAFLPVKQNLNAWLQAIIRFAYTLVPIGLAVGYLLQTTVEDAYYG